MSEGNIVTVRQLPSGEVVELLPDGTTRPVQSRTDWERVRGMTEEEIMANALSDPDNPPLTDEELSRMRRVPDPKRIRRRLRLTQIEFANTFEIPLGTLRDWEQGTRMPDSAARTLLRVIERDPDSVIAALRR